MADTQQIAVGTSGTEGAYVQNVFNSLEKKNTLTVTFTASGSAAALNAVYISSGTGDTTRKSLPANVTMTGDYSGSNGYADLQDFLRNNALEITAIGLQTDQTNNYSQELVIGEQTPNRRNQPETRYNLSDFRVSTGNGFADSLTMQDGVKGFQKFVTMPNLWILLNLLQSSYVKVTFYLSRVQKAAPLSPLS